MLSEFGLNGLISLFLRAKARASSYIGNGEMCLTRVCEHIILFELKICQESIAAHPTDYSKSLNLAVPLCEFDKLLQDSCYRQLIHYEANFEAGLAFVL